MTSRYHHFCPAARTLETIGDRWSLLIVRDLLPGPRRFSDLRRLLTNVTPKWLTIRLRQLEANGIVRRDQQPGRREVWYELTDKGRDLAPVVEALLAWGIKYELHPLTPDEATHAEHLVTGLIVALNEVAAKPTRPRAWRLQLGDSGYDLTFDGDRWSLADSGRPPDVVVTTTADAWARFLTQRPEQRRLPTPGIQVSGAPQRVAELITTFNPASADPGDSRSPSTRRRPPTHSTNRPEE